MCITQLHERILGFFHKGGVIDWIDVLVTEFERKVLMVLYGHIMDLVNYVGWIGRGVKHMSIDSTDGTQV